MRLIRRLTTLAALLIGALLPSAAGAATLYIAEYPNIGAIGTNITPWAPGPTIATQQVVVGGGSLQSSAFNAKTKAVMVMCDVGCSVEFGVLTTDSPTATTTDVLLQQGVPYNFVVSPSTKVAVIANTAGDTPGGSSTPSSIVITPSSSATAAVSTVSSTAVESNHVIKATPGNLYGLSVTTGAAAGFVFVSNTTTAPTAGGAAIAPVKCYAVAANSTIGVAYNPPIALSTGITIVFSTTGCFTNTASATAFISGDYK